MKQLRATLILVLIAGVASGLAKPDVVLTSSDISLIVDGLDLSNEVRSKVAADAEQRKALAKELREILAVAEEAKTARYMTRPELRLQMQLARSYNIAAAYQKSLPVKTPPNELVTSAEVEAFFKQPNATTGFEAFIEDYRKNRPNNIAPITDEERKPLRETYAWVMIAEQKGTAAGFDRARKTELMIMVQQARLLANAYVNDPSLRKDPTQLEVEQYLSAHPDLNPRNYRVKAEEVLKRARAGENFDALARQYSEDETSKVRGGDIGWFGRGEMVKSFEDAAFSLKPGEISGVVESSFGYHVIKLDERRTQLDEQSKPVEQLRARHILILFKHEFSFEYAPAIKAIEGEKKRQLIDQIVRQGRVVVPADFTVTVAPQRSGAIN